MITTPETTQKTSRRTVLKSTAAAGAVLLIGFDVSQPAKGAPIKKVVNPLRSWVQIDQAGKVTILFSHSEMGQGISSALPLALADELGVDWKTVHVTQAPNDPSTFGFQGTGGSGSVAGTFLPVRKAGAAAREMLITAAAQKWNVSPSACIARNGSVFHGNKKFHYGDLVTTAAALPIPDLDKVPLKKPEEFTLIGKENIQRKDIPLKTDGSAKFGLDTRVPGMVYAMVERCPTFGGKVKSFDASAAKSIAGVHDIFEILAVPQGVHSWGGVVVIADSTWIAMQARKKLRIEWDLGPHANESSESLRRQFRRLVDSPMKVVLNEGDADAAINSAPTARKVEADYELPFEAHATMEPMNITMHITADRAEAWAPVQGPEWIFGVIAQVTGLKPENIVIHTTYLGGGFGRRYQADFAMECAQIAKRIGKPVQLVWSREDDMTHDFYRPASYHRISGAIDEQGNIVAWKHKSTSTSIAEWFSPKEDPNSSEMGCTLQMPYLTKSYRLEYEPAKSGVPRAWWRSVEASVIGFVMESYMDELAHAAKADPYEFRLAKLAGNRLVKNPKDPQSVPLDTARMTGVLKLAAEKSNWGQALPAGRGRGIACHYSFNSYVANVAEVTVDRGQLHVDRIVSAVDIGTAVHLDGIRAQVESAIVFGLTAALKSQITIANGASVENNFNKFTTLSMKETPRIEVYIVQSNLPPTGIGEPGLPPTAPALTNAIFAATGKRIRRLPLQLSDLV